MSTLVYNGFTGLQHVRISNYESEAKLADDGISHETTRHHVMGTALIAASTKAAFILLLQQARRLLAAPRADFSYSINGTTVQTISAPDDLEGPHAKFTINEIKGFLSALVTFDITYHLFEVAAGGVNHVLSHRWVQTWGIENNGLGTHEVAGSLRVRANAPGGSSGFALGPNPDAYRNLVVPTLPPGFRRKKMQFATDPTGTMLVYTVSDEECAHKLPAPALDGDAHFRYKRGIDAGSILGLKTLDIELEGDRLTNPADLLASAMRCARNRIVFAGPNADQVLSIEIHEIEMFKRNRLRLVINARGAAAVGENAVFNPPNFDLLQELASGPDISAYIPPNPYGAGLVRSVRRALYGPASVSLPKAEWEAADDVPTTEVTLPKDAVIAIEAGLIPAGQVGEVSAAHLEYPYLHVDIRERWQVDNQVAVLAAQSIAGADVPYQVRKPIAQLLTEITVSRQGAPPTLPTIATPPGSVITHQQGAVNISDIDGNNNRRYTLHFTRTVRMLAVGNGSFPIDAGLLYFWPINGRMARPFDPRSDNSTGFNLFSDNPSDPGGTTILGPATGIYNP